MRLDQRHWRHDSSDDPPLADDNYPNWSPADCCDVCDCPRVHLQPDLGDYRAKVARLNNDRPPWPGQSFQRCYEDGADQLRRVYADGAFHEVAEIRNGFFRCNTGNDIEFTSLYWLLRPFMFRQYLPPNIGRRSQLVVGEVLVGKPTTYEVYPPPNPRRVKAYRSLSAHPVPVPVLVRWLTCPGCYDALQREP